MSKQVLILGGYGNFGKLISIALAKAHIPIIISGRHANRAEQLASEISAAYAGAQVEAASFDVAAELDANLKKYHPAVVINTCGPFQTADYSVAQACIRNQSHYIDLADAREFVNGITSLNTPAKANDVIVISGASTVPGLSSAVMEKYKDRFKVIESLTYGISPGAKAPRGLATTQGILTYLGKPLKPVRGQTHPRYGWQDLYRQNYPQLGKRWMANIDIPDLDIFPEKYGIQSIRFSAGMESSILHLSMWALSWLVRLGLPINLSAHARGLLSLSSAFDWTGTADGGMHMIIKGKTPQGEDLILQWFLIAKNADGPQIPCVPAILLTKKILAGELRSSGAYTCTGWITLDECLRELKDFSIREYVY
ncbi:saccharopine dehydrogenase family protein [Aquicella siphonis]|uniref:saccharopine dehydrogenase family protein n=1 Tax=Aquicella siphonis TaxID=254247 RepID=UPI0011DD9E7B|nr:saccharopine dehydrogenase NADP-binding domain-containing protein [Aquicella siphonis]